MQNETADETAETSEKSVYPDGMPTGRQPCLPACIAAVLMEAADDDLTPVCFRLTGETYDRMCIAFGFRFTKLDDVPVNILPPQCPSSVLLAAGPRFPMKNGGLYLQFDDTLPGTTIPAHSGDSRWYQNPALP